MVHIPQKSFTIRYASLLKTLTMKKNNHEEKRTVREGLTGEDLSVFDLMVKDVPLNDKERDEVKSIAKQLV